VISLAGRVCHAKRVEVALNPRTLPTRAKKRTHGVPRGEITAQKSERSNHARCATGLGMAAQRLVCPSIGADWLAECQPPG
jgi:hypothetical protein